jgi:hypothetical protein
MEPMGLRIQHSAVRQHPAQALSDPSALLSGNADIDGRCDSHGRVANRNASVLGTVASGVSSDQAGSRQRASRRLNRREAVVVISRYTRATAM